MLKILIVAPAWIGDMVMAKSLLQLLKQKHPDCIIDVLAPAWSFPIVERMAEVNEAIVMPVGHGKLQLGVRYQVAKMLREKQYQRSYVLPNSWKSALIPWLAKIPVRIGWKGEMRWGLLTDIRRLDKKAYPLMVSRYLALGDEPNAAIDHRQYYPVLTANEHERIAALDKYRLTVEKPVLVLCPGAQYGSSKRWPIEYFAKVANEKLKQQWQVWLLGGKGEKEIVDAINELTAEQCVDLTATTLGEAVDLLSMAKVVVSNDSGLMHIAAALCRPMVAVFGSSSPGFTPPLSDDVSMLSLELPCKPCFKRECPLQHHHCMKKITPEMVLEKIESYESSID